MSIVDPKNLPPSQPSFWPSLRPWKPNDQTISTIYCVHATVCSFDKKLSSKWELLSTAQNTIHLAHSLIFLSTWKEPKLFFGVLGLTSLFNQLVLLKSSVLLPEQFLNIAPRIASVSQALYEKKYTKILFDALGFSALFIPSSSSKIISIGVDILFECVNYYQNSHPKDGNISLKERKDQTDLLNAQEYFGVKDIDNMNINLIKKTFDYSLTTLDKKIMALSGVWKRELELDRKDLSTAYNTLCQAAQEKQTN